MYLINLKNIIPFRSEQSIVNKFFKLCKWDLKIFQSENIIWFKRIMHPQSNLYIMMLNFPNNIAFVGFIIYLCKMTLNYLEMKTFPWKEYSCMAPNIVSYIFLHDMCHLLWKLKEQYVVTHISIINLHSTKDNLLPTMDRWINFWVLTHR